MRESEISEPWWVATGLLLKQVVAPEAVARRRPHGAFGRRCSPGVCFSEVTEDTLAQNWRTVCRLSRESLCSVMLAQSAGHPEPHCYGETARQTPQDDPASPECLWVSLADLRQGQTAGDLLPGGNPIMPLATKLSTILVWLVGFQHRTLKQVPTGQGQGNRLSVESGCHRSHLAPDSCFSSSTPCPARLGLCSCSPLSSSNAYNVGPTAGNQPCGKETAMVMTEMVAVPLNRQQGSPPCRSRNQAAGEASSLRREARLISFPFLKIINFDLSLSPMPCHPISCLSACVVGTVRRRGQHWIGVGRWLALPKSGKSSPATSGTRTRP